MSESDTQNESAPGAVPWVEDRVRCGCCGAQMQLDAIRSPDRFFSRDDVYTLDACPDCGTVVLWAPGWDAETAYPSDYPAHAADPAVKWYHRALPRYFFPAVPKGSPDPIVEIGTGTGQFLAYLQGLGRSVSGFEMDEAAVERARAAGIAVQPGTWEDFQSEDESVGVLVMNQVIEHLLQPPAGVFAKTLRALKPGGAWVIRTPNAGAWGRHHFAGYWHPLEVPRHTVIYSLRGITQLAERAGFSVASARCCGRWYDFGQSARYRIDAGAARPWDYLLDLRKVGSPFSRVLAVAANARGRGDSMEVILSKPDR